MSTKGECRGGSCLGFTSHGVVSVCRMSYVVGDDSTEWDLFHVVCVTAFRVSVLVFLAPVACRCNMYWNMTHPSSGTLVKKDSSDLRFTHAWY